MLVLWHLLTLSGLPGTESLPSPIEVLASLVQLMGSSTFWVAIATTMRSWAIGLALCCLIGIPAGLLLGASKPATVSTRWILDFFRTIPTIALLPLILLLFGPTMRMELTMIVLSAVWPMLIQSMYAVKQIEPLHKWVMRVFRIGFADRLRYLWAPSVALFVSTGMRLAATMSLLMAIAAEYIGGAPGIGQQLSYMEQALDRPGVFAYAITAGTIGFLINVLLQTGQDRLLWWHPIIRERRSR
ncbi:MAG: ABC transporter permease subunit [Dermatophilus congolensis]|nr:ABC transporter permease subunit [Dermatophilus congolensis]